MIADCYGNPWPTTPVAWPSGPFASNGFAAVSAAYELLVVGGGTDDGTVTGVHTEQAKMLNLKSGVWEELDLNGSDLAGHIIGSNYAPADEAIWMVSSDEEGLLKVVRWEFLVPGAWPEVIAEFPQEWGECESAEILGLSDGATVVALSRGAESRAVMFARSGRDLVGVADTTCSTLRSPVPVDGGSVALFGFDSLGTPCSVQLGGADYGMVSPEPQLQ